MRLLMFLLVLPLAGPAQVPKLRAVMQAVKQGDCIQAMPMLHAFINSTQPIDERAAAHYYRARCLVRYQSAAEDYLRAIEDYQTALFLDKDKWAAEVQLALAELQPMLVRLGLEQLEKARQIRSPAQKAAEIQLASQLSKAAERIMPEDYLPKYLLGLIHLERAEIPLARRYLLASAVLFQQYLPKQPDILAAYIYYRLALVQRHQCMESGPVPGLMACREALNYVEKAREVLEAEYERARRQRGHDGPVYQRQREQAEADFYYLELELLMQLPEKRTEAQDKVALALKREPDNYDLLLGYGQLVESTDMERAIQVYQRAVDLIPNRPEAHFQLGTLFYNRGVMLVREAEQAADVSKYRQLHNLAKDYFTKSRPHLVATHHLRPDDMDILDALIQVSQYLHIAGDYRRYRAKREAMPAGRN
jgi:tetratricopeptide (TPR) repeat protein